MQTRHQQAEEITPASAMALGMAHLRGFVEHTREPAPGLLKARDYFQLAARQWQSPVITSPAQTTPKSEPKPRPENVRETRLMAQAYACATEQRRRELQQVTELLRQAQELLMGWRARAALEKVNQALRLLRKFTEE